MKQEYKAIIFDMDGTIVDTNGIWENATNHLITRRGIEYSIELQKEINHKAHGLAIHKSCEIIKDIIGLEDSIESLILETTNIASGLYESGIKFIDGFEDFHKLVMTYNIKTGIATNADDNTLSITTNTLKLDRFFGEHIYNISKVNNVCKPDPAVYLHAAKSLGVDPINCIAIEDSAHGIKAAKRAGMLCIGINTHGKPEQIKEADIKIDRFCDIDLEKLLKNK